MKELSFFVVLFIIHHSIATSMTKYKRITIDASTWNPMEIRSHSDNAARGLVERIELFELISCLFNTLVL